MKPVSGKRWSGAYSFRPFEVRITDREFAFSRRSMAGQKRPSNLSAVWTARLQERLVNGVLQGRTQFSPQGASALCKKRMWKAVADTVALLDIAGFESILSHETYQALKEDTFLENRRKVKDDVRAEALKGWIRNGGDDFALGL